MESNDQASPATQGRVQRLVDEICLLLTRVALCNPPGIKHFTLTRVEEAPAGSHPGDERVPQVARALSITGQQRRELSQLRSLFLAKLSRIVAERKDVHSLLGSAIPVGLSSNRAMAARYLGVHDAVRRLRDNLREEHILVLDFVSTIFKHVSVGVPVPVGGLRWVGAGGWVGR